MTQDAEDIHAMRQAFWRKFRGEITQSELESIVELIMSRQLVLPEVKNGR
ncbi:MAG: hypothetical protein DDT18_00882 [Actinobacteria bacterium]|nr:hypothetical protein [Actinomycetota bacterium]